MIEENNVIQEKNIELLTEGFWYENLPPIWNMEQLKLVMKQILVDIENDLYGDFKKDDKGLICEFKNTESPEYIFNDGIEPITFFEFKKNGALREMQIPNLKYYGAFIFNTIAVYHDLFRKLYGQIAYQKYVSNSNSYILIDELFQVYRDYDGEEELLEGGIFAVKNNKTTGQLTYEVNNGRYLEIQGSKLYSVKVDIESFFPNVYTHYLSKIKGYEPYKENFDCDEYFDFLDYYNMKINNNQTKGIAAGVFSSSLSAELLMLCVDFEIKNVLGDSISYIRYVDDMSFFSDSLEEIYSKLPLVQRVLNKYRLRINNDKTEMQRSIYNMSYVDIYELKNRFNFLSVDVDEPFTINKDLFYNIKGYISRAFGGEKKAEIKAFLTLLRKAIENKRLIFNENSSLKLEKHMVAYMMQLACIDPSYSSRCYKIIIELLKLSEGKNVHAEILDIVKSKDYFINNKYHDSVLQIWHYYVRSNFENDVDIKELIKSFGDDEINPVILACFIKEKKGENKIVFDYIKNRYSSTISQHEDKNYWKRSVMFSKWWLPLLMIYIKDGKDYHKFYESNNFHKIYKCMRKENNDIHQNN